MTILRKGLAKTCESFLTKQLSGQQNFDSVRSAHTDLDLLTKKPIFFVRGLTGSRIVRKFRAPLLGRNVGMVMYGSNPQKIVIARRATQDSQVAEHD